LADVLGVTVEELVSVLKKKKARVPFEIGAFVTLEACDAMIGAPARVTIRDIRVTEDGRVSLFSAPNSATSAEAAKAATEVLAYLLVAAGPGVPQSLVELVERGPSDGQWDLTRLRDELEASLVPLNRSAARRVLSRMLREAAGEFQARRASAAPPVLTANDLDAELDAMVGGPPKRESVAARREPVAPGPEENRHIRPTPQVLYRPEDLPANPRVPPPPRVPHDSRALGDDVWREAPARRGDDPQATTLSEADSKSSPRTDLSDPFDVDQLKTTRRDAVSPDEVDRLLADHASRGNGREPPRRIPDEEPTYSPRRPVPAERPIGYARGPELDLAEMEDVTPKRGRALIWIVLLLGLTVGLVALVAYLRPDFVDRIMGRETDIERQQREIDENAQQRQAQINEDHRRSFGDLSIHVTPADAQILLFIGRGPAETAHLPIGRAQEFVAIPDGKAPTRAVIPANATWTPAEGGEPRYELAMQSSETDMAFENLDLGPTRLTTDMGTATGQLGTARVITNPPGAKVFMVIGFTSAKIENTRTDQAMEILVFLPGYRAFSKVIGPSDWVDDGDKPRAEINVTLEELTPAR
jgi:hypothetical protein